MIFQKPELFTGWGNYPKHKSVLVEPYTLEELKNHIKDKDMLHTLARGLGRSYGDTSINLNGNLISQKHFSHFIHFDSETGILEAEGGVSFEEILDVCIPKGFFLPVTPGTKFVTVGGAIANDVHGKNHHLDGCFSEHVLSFELLTAKGDVINCSRKENSDIFWATVGGIGLTGFILRVVIKMIPISSSYIEVEYQKANNIHEAIDMFQVDDNRFQYSVAWIDCVATGNKLGRSVLMRGNHMKSSHLSGNKILDPLKVEDKLKLNIPFYLPSFVLNGTTIKMFNHLYYAKYKNSSVVTNYDSFFYPLDMINNWNRGYGKNGFVQYQMVLPFENGKEGLIQLLTLLSQYKKTSFLAVLKTFGKQNKGLLSFPFEGYTLALDIPIKNESVFALLNELDKIVLRFGGRTYLAKDSRMSPETFRQMYPNIKQFLEIKQELDPNDVFQSSMSRRLNLTGVR